MNMFFFSFRLFFFIICLCALHFTLFFRRFALAMVKVENEKRVRERKEYKSRTNLKQR
jgi:hypothetical protein